MLEEKRFLDELVKAGTISTYKWIRRENDDLWLSADLSIGPLSQSIELRFPNRYPGECPSIRPLPYGTRLSTHQFGGDGVLCLELGPDNWHSRYNAADLIRSTWKLLASEIIEPKTIPSRHIDTLGMTARRHVFRLILTRSLQQAVEANTGTNEIEYASFSENAALIFWVTQLPKGTALAPIPPKVAKLKGTLGLIVPVYDGAPSLPKDTAAFRTYLRDCGVPEVQAASAVGLTILTDGATVQARWIPRKTDGAILTVAQVPVEIDGNDRVGTSWEITSGATVAIVGLGSLGSKVATSLVRSGVQKATTVDGDVFLAENVVRHDADYAHVGLMKTEAAAARMGDVASHPIAVSEHDHDVTDASNPEVHEQTTKALQNATLIIDATANADAFNFLAHLASEEQLPLLWAEVFAGGIGGYVAYAAPGVTPCPSCVRAAFLAYLDNWPPAPRGAVSDYGYVEADVPIVASDADVTLIAAAMTNSALRVISKDFDAFPPITIFGLREGWIFEQAFETHSLSVRTDDFSCPNCWTRPTAPDPDSLARVEELLADASAENPTES